MQMPFGSGDMADTGAWLDDVRRAEQAGFYAISVPDHVGRELPQLGPFAALGAAAVVSSEIRLTTTVVNNDFRPPAVLAKELATVDRLSEGRLGLGIGAGWMESDYAEAGLRMDRPGVRIERLGESVRVLKALLAGEQVTFAGEYYELDRHAVFPPPVQKRVPLLIGGGGPRILRLAAREADIVGIIANLGSPDGRDVRPQTIREQVALVRGAASERSDEITLAVRVLFGAVGDRAELATRFAAELGMSEEQVLETPYGLVGSAAEIKEHLLRVRDEYGISHFTLHKATADEIAPFAAELAGL
jgi:probable F420-dependent oxidoreductase